MTGFQRWCLAGLRLGASRMTDRARWLEISELTVDPEDVRLLAAATADACGVVVAQETYQARCELCGDWYQSTGQHASCGACRRV